MSDRDDEAQRIAEALRPSAPDWVLVEPGYMPLREAGIESRFAVSNGFLGVRGARSMSRGPMWMSFLHTLSWASWPRSFVAGFFDTPNTEPPVPALVPAPDWLRLRVLFDGQPQVLRSGELLGHHRTLDLCRGVLLTDWDHRDREGRVLRTRSLRLVSLADRALGLQVVWFTVEERGAEVTVDAALEIANSGLELVSITPEVALWQTTESDRCLAMASAAELRVNGRRLAPTVDDQLRREWTWTCRPGDAATFWRIVAVARGDQDGDAVRARAPGALGRGRAAGWERLLEQHAAAWRERWTASDVEVDGDPEAQRALRFAVYHLASAANPEDERVSIGARALTGDAYLGHVFWDTEIYLLPFYTLTWPEAARALLMYRWHTLDGARRKAARLGYRGALYAWESADTGDEVTPEQIIDPDGRFIEVLCGTLEQHISADVAYAVWQYWQATGDDAFMLDAGAEILLETARFWASRAEPDSADGSRHISNVIGPDEYHEHVDDNAFTNAMARWNILRALDVASWLRAEHPERGGALLERLAVDDAELAAWRTAAERITVLFDEQTRLYEQFRGFHQLEYIDLTQYAGRTVPMDVVLGRERTQQSQVIKQADVVALVALLADEITPEIAEANLRYYEPRCGHGSSLSRSMHAVVAARLGDVALAARYFQETAATDLDDTRGGSAGGVRIAALGGLWQTAMFGFAGVAVRPDGLALDPHLPPSWQTMRFRVQWRGRRVHVAIDAAGRTACATLESGEPMTLHVGGAGHRLEAGRPVRARWSAETS
jgi:trehalose/maltose hydrolase-like predicted phosphorylase